MAAGLSACSSVDLEPTNQYDISFAFKSVGNAELYLNHLYQVDRIFSPFGSCALGGSNANLSDGLTETLKYGGIVAGVGDCNLIMTVDGQQSVQQNYFDCWTTGYGWVRRLNEFIAGVDDYGNFSKHDGARLKAEAQFLRAEVEFYMMRSHASAKDDLGIILYHSIDKMAVETKNTARSSVSECWDAIAEDLRWAVEFLPEPAEARGRLHKYAAQALMARAMLYAGRYEPARKAAEAVRDSKLYGYLDNYADVFKTVDNREVIWGSAFTSGVQTHSFDSKYSMPGDYCTSGGKGGGYAGPTQEFVDMYDNADGTPFSASGNERYITSENVSSRDPRLAQSVLYNGAVWKGRAIECYEGGIDQKYMPYGSQNNPGNTVTGYYMRKMLDESNKDFDVNGSYQPWCSFRYAETMLILSECQAREGKYEDCRKTVEELRKARFGRDDVFTAPVSDMESALDLILHERAIELCFEGHRFWDLRRTGRAKAVLDGKSYTGVLWKKSGESFVPTMVSCSMGRANSYPERFDRFPIPQSEISNNTQARQNADW